jgi:hypothetical protein
MNLLFINHDPDLPSQMDDFMCNSHDRCFCSRNTTETIRILDEQSIDFAVLIVNHLRDAVVLKYLNDERKELEVLLVVSEEFDEIITLFYDSQYKTIRLPLQFNSLLENIGRMIAEGGGLRGLNSLNNSSRNMVMH